MKLLYKKFGVAVLFLIASSRSHASLEECIKKCTNNAPESKEDCIELGWRSSYSVKTIVDVINLFRSPSLPNVNSNLCPRHNVKVDSKFTSFGDRCTEWSISLDGDNDHSVGFYSSVELPQNLAGQYDNGALQFSSQKAKPIISLQSNGEVISELQGRILSAKDVKWGHYTLLVLETDSICYSVTLDF